MPTCDDDEMPSPLSQSECGFSDEVFLRDYSEAITILTDWMLEDVVALAESFDVDPHDLFRAAVGAFSGALEPAELASPGVQPHGETRSPTVPPKRLVDTNG
ncbi:MAG TPA: hypothetical protein VNJ52_07870 [Patescibacteria group bacterium]|nr:hypothetical protein [Patescibacteria group bacterium]